MKCKIAECPCHKGGSVWCETHKSHSCPSLYPLPMNKTTWVERFNQTFPFRKDTHKVEFLGRFVLKSKMVEFIESELQQQRKEIIKIIASGYITTADGTPLPSYVCEPNKILDDIIKKVGGK